MKKYRVNVKFGPLSILDWVCVTSAVALMHKKTKSPNNQSVEAALGDRHRFFVAVFCAACLVCACYGQR